LSSKVKQRTPKSQQPRNDKEEKKKMSCRWQVELALTANCKCFDEKRQRNTSQNHLKYDKVQAVELALTRCFDNIQQRINETKTQVSSM
jgi:hypothetical protein